MSNPWFAFKQFTLWHDKCAMKTGTDGVLLGAWVRPAEAKSILDVGAGTGLISLMMAQKSLAKIDAVEIDDAAALQALENCRRSKWSERITVYNEAFRQFAKVTPAHYDLIVSNPPYFKTLHKAPNPRRSIARHSDSLTLEELVELSVNLLTMEGRLALIIPCDLRTDLLRIAAIHGFWLTRETIVHSTPEKSPFRVLVELSRRKSTAFIQTDLIIRNAPGGSYTEEFKELTRDYYLAF